MNLKDLYYYHLLRTIELPEKKLYFYQGINRIYLVKYYDQQTLAMGIVDAMVKEAGEITKEALK
jgi:hypothetical protein